ncbi:MmcQ/YjbR family DNA-binding protein [Mycolicibacterium mengxianglii]|uniref:MmcQ/YjbR family DNA-binding protein n=1 Tax=Mycolicibacterium mengxianglii TaxID=2736649 RepID=UPI0018D0231D|nr:MmcQ/YjbR family DNA-binding protein [Mycolicibacterium mengxianglii]
MARFCGIDDFVDLIGQLDEVVRTDFRHYAKFGVSSRTLGYLWPETSTVGLRQTISEQLALVAERPSVFEVQFTSGDYGWVVVHLSRITRDELAELTFEAWRLTASETLVAQRADRLPV